MAPNLSNEDIAFIDQSGNAVGELWSDIYRPRDTRNPVLRELEKYRKEAAMPAFRPDAVYSPAGDFFGNFPHGSADATTRLPTTFTTSGPAVGGQSTDNFGAIGNRSMGVFGGFMGNSPMDPAAPMRGLGAADFSGYQLRRVSSAFPDITLRDLNQSAPRPLDDEHGQADMRTLEANFLSSGNMNDAVALYNARKLIRGGDADWSDI